MEDIVPDLDPTPGEDKRQDMERIGEMTDRSPQTHGEWEKEKNRRVTEGRMTIHQTEAEQATNPCCGGSTEIQYTVHKEGQTKI